MGLDVAEDEERFPPPFPDPKEGDVDDLRETLSFLDGITDDEERGELGYPPPLIMASLLSLPILTILELDVDRLESSLLRW